LGGVEDGSLAVGENSRTRQSSDVANDKAITESVRKGASQCRSHMPDRLWMEAPVGKPLESLIDIVDPQLGQPNTAEFGDQVNTNG